MPANLPAQHDSGARPSVFNERGAFINLRPHREPIAVANGQIAYTEGIGTISMYIQTQNGAPIRIHLPGSLYCPTFPTNLLSAYHLSVAGIGSWIPPGGHGLYLGRHGEPFRLAADSSYSLTLASNTTATANSATSLLNLDATLVKVKNAHIRWNHAPLDQLSSLTSDDPAFERVNSGDIALVRSSWHCAPCALSRATAPPHATTGRPIRTSRPFSLLHLDVLDISRQGGGGHTYALIIVDDFTRYTWTLPLVSKGDATAELQAFIRREHRQHPDRPLQTVRSDNAPELTTAMDEFYCELGVVSERTNPGESASNGVAERAIRSITDRARLMVVANRLIPDEWWEHSLLAATYAHNQSPPKALGGDSRFVRYHGFKPSLRMRGFGTLAYLHLLPNQREGGKLGPRAVPAMLVGYGHGRGSKGWLFAIHQDDGQVGFRWKKPSTWTHVPYTTEYPTHFHLDPLVPPGGGEVRGGGEMGAGGKPDSSPPRRVRFAIDELTRDTNGKKENAPTKKRKLKERKTGAHRPAQAKENENSEPGPTPPTPITEDAVDTGHQVLLPPPSSSPPFSSLSPTGTLTPVTVPLTDDAIPALVRRNPVRQARINAPPLDLSIPANDNLHDATFSLLVNKAPSIFGNPAALSALGIQALVSIFGPAPDTSMLPASEPSLPPIALAIESAANDTEVILTTDGVPVAPKNIKKLVGHPAFDGVLEAMRLELRRFDERDVKEVVPIPPGIKPLPGMWVLGTKTDADANFLKYRARYVVGGHRQVPGTWAKSFAPAVRTAAVNTLIALAEADGLHLFSADVEAAYLYADINELVYVRPPPFFPEAPGHCWRLKKSLYGLHQSGANFGDWLRTFLCDRLHFTSLKSEPCLFIRRTEPLGLILIAVHTDDFLVACRSQEAYDELLVELRRSIQIKSNGPLRFHLGCQYDRINGRLYISQPKFIAETLAAHDISPQRPRYLPIGHQLPPPKRPEHEKRVTRDEHRTYRSIVGSSLWAARMSRPDALFAATFLARFMDDPSAAHRRAAEDLLRFFAGTSDYSLCLTPNRSRPLLELHTDASFASDKSNSHSISGHVVFVFGVPVSWGSKSQNQGVSNTAASEYLAMGDGLRDALFIRNILFELGVCKANHPIELFVDNTAAKALAEKLGSLGKIREIDVSYHEVRERIHRGEIKVHYTPGAHHLPDWFTKPLSLPKIISARNNFDLASLSSR